ncbi:hypothetical protein H9P43_002691 [Blastocladiella emersonii ATCC 22665]|nr:hypothetical protein H9P43_002691 [Blastocladiella emersonii ATCC 22665]
MDRPDPAPASAHQMQPAEPALPPRATRAAARIRHVFLRRASAIRSDGVIGTAVATDAVSATAAVRLGVSAGSYGGGGSGGASLNNSAGHVRSLAVPAHRASAKELVGSVNVPTTTSSVPNLGPPRSGTTPSLVPPRRPSTRSTATAASHSPEALTGPVFAVRDETNTATVLHFSTRSIMTNASSGHGHETVQVSRVADVDRRGAELQLGGGYSRSLSGTASPLELSGMLPVTPTSLSTCPSSEAGSGLPESPTWKTAPDSPDIARASPPARSRRSSAGSFAAQLSEPNTRATSAASSLSDIFSTPDLALSDPEVLDPAVLGLGAVEPELIEAAAPASPPHHAATRREHPEAPPSRRTSHPHPPSSRRDSDATSRRRRSSATSPSRRSSFASTAALVSALPSRFLGSAWTVLAAGNTRILSMSTLRFLRPILESKFTEYSSRILKLPMEILAWGALTYVLLSMLISSLSSVAFREALELCPKVMGRCDQCQRLVTAMLIAPAALIVLALLAPKFTKWTNMRRWVLVTMAFVVLAVTNIVGALCPILCTVATTGQVLLLAPISMGELCPGDKASSMAAVAENALEWIDTGRNYWMGSASVTLYLLVSASILPFRLSVPLALFLVGFTVSLGYALSSNPLAWVWLFAFNLSDDFVKSTFALYQRELLHRASFYLNVRQTSEKQRRVSTAAAPPPRAVPPITIQSSSTADIAARNLFDVPTTVVSVTSTNVRVGALQFKPGFLGKPSPGHEGAALEPIRSGLLDGLTIESGSSSSGTAAPHPHQHMFPHLKFTLDEPDGDRPPGPLVAPLSILDLNHHELSMMMQGPTMLRPFTGLVPSATLDITAISLRRLATLPRFSQSSTEFPRMPSSPHPSVDNFSNSSWIVAGLAGTLTSGLTTLHGNPNTGFTRASNPAQATMLDRRLVEQLQAATLYIASASHVDESSVRAASSQGGTLGMAASGSAAAGATAERIGEPMTASMWQMVPLEIDEEDTEDEDGSEEVDRKSKTTITVPRNASVGARTSATLTQDDSQALVALWTADVNRALLQSSLCPALGSSLASSTSTSSSAADGDQAFDMWATPVESLSRTEMDAASAAPTEARPASSPLSPFSYSAGTGSRSNPGTDTLPSGNSSQVGTPRSDTGLLRSAPNWRSPVDAIQATTTTTSPTLSPHLSMSSTQPDSSSGASTPTPLLGAVSATATFERQQHQPQVASVAPPTSTDAAGSTRRRRRHAWRHRALLVVRKPVVQVFRVLRQIRREIFYTFPSHALENEYREYSLRKLRSRMQLTAASNLLTLSLMLIIAGSTRGAAAAGTVDGDLLPSDSQSQARRVRWSWLVGVFPVITQWWYPMLQHLVLNMSVLVVLRVPSMHGERLGRYAMGHVLFALAMVLIQDTLIHLVSSSYELRQSSSHQVIATLLAMTTLRLHPRVHVPILAAFLAGALVERTILYWDHTHASIFITINVLFMLALVSAVLNLFFESAHRRTLRFQNSVLESKFTEYSSRILKLPMAILSCGALLFVVLSALISWLSTCAFRDVLDLCPSIVGQCDQCQRIVTAMFAAPAALLVLALLAPRLTKWTNQRRWIIVTVSFFCLAITNIVGALCPIMCTVTTTGQSLLFAPITNHDLCDGAIDTDLAAVAKHALKWIDTGRNYWMGSASVTLYLLVSASILPFRLSVPLALFLVGFTVSLGYSLSSNPLAWVWLFAFNLSDDFVKSTFALYQRELLHRASFYLNVRQTSEKQRRVPAAAAPPPRAVPPITIQSSSLADFTRRRPDAPAAAAGAATTNVRVDPPRVYAQVFGDDGGVLKQIQSRPLSISSAFGSATGEPGSGAASPTAPSSQQTPAFSSEESLGPLVSPLSILDRYHHEILTQEPATHRGLVPSPTLDIAAVSLRRLATLPRFSQSSAEFPCPLSSSDPPLNNLNASWVVARLTGTMSSDRARAVLPEHVLLQPALLYIAPPSGTADSGSPTNGAADRADPPTSASMWQLVPLVLDEEQMQPPTVPRSSSAEAWTSVALTQDADGRAFLAMWTDDMRCALMQPAPASSLASSAATSCPSVYNGEPGCDIWATPAESVSRTELDAVSSVAGASVAMASSEAELPPPPPSPSLLRAGTGTRSNADNGTLPSAPFPSATSSQVGTPRINRSLLRSTSNWRSPIITATETMAISPAPSTYLSMASTQPGSFSGTSTPVSLLNRRSPTATLEWQQQQQQVASSSTSTATNSTRSSARCGQQNGAHRKTVLAQFLRVLRHVRRELFYRFPSPALESEYRAYSLRKLRTRMQLTAASNLVTLTLMLIIAGITQGAATRDTATNSDATSMPATTSGDHGHVRHVRWSWLLGAFPIVTQWWYPMLQQMLVNSSVLLVLRFSSIHGERLGRYAMIHVLIALAVVLVQDTLIYLVSSSYELRQSSSHQAIATLLAMTTLRLHPRVHVPILAAFLAGALLERVILYWDHAHASIFITINVLFMLALVSAVLNLFFESAHRRYFMLRSDREQATRGDNHT